MVKQVEKDKLNSIEKRQLVKSELERTKFEFQKSEQNKERVSQMAQGLLPKIFFVFEGTINSDNKLLILEVISKMIGLMGDDVLIGTIDPKQFAHFIY